MNTVDSVAGMARQGCFQGSLEDKFGFHHVKLYLDS